MQLLNFPCSTLSPRPHESDITKSAYFAQGIIRRVTMRRDVSFPFPEQPRTRLRSQNATACFLKYEEKVAPRRRLCSLPVATVGSRASRVITPHSSARSTLTAFLLLVAARLLKNEEKVASRRRLQSWESGFQIHHLVLLSLQRLLDTLFVGCSCALVEVQGGGGISSPLLLCRSELGTVGLACTPQLVRPS